MTADIDAKLAAYPRDRAPEARYASFDYCYNHFQEAREAGRTSRLADNDHLTGQPLCDGRSPFASDGCGLLSVMTILRESANQVSRIACWQIDDPLRRQRRGPWRRATRAST